MVKGELDDDIPGCALRLLRAERAMDQIELQAFYGYCWYQLLEKNGGCGGEVSDSFWDASKVEVSPARAILIIFQAEQGHLQLFFNVCGVLFMVLQDCSGCLYFVFQVTGAGSEVAVDSSACSIVLKRARSASRSASCGCIGTCSWLSHMSGGCIESSDGDREKGSRLVAEFSKNTHTLYYILLQRSWQ